MEKQPTLIRSRDPTDARSFAILVAGPAALLVAKPHKLWERHESVSRLEDKDAADVFRLLRALSTERLAEGFTVLLRDPLSSAVATAARLYFEQLFGERSPTGIQMVRRTLAIFEDADVLSVSCVELARDLLAEITKRNL